MEMKEYNLSPEELEGVQEISKQIQELQQQYQGAIRMIAKIHGLQGNWNFEGTKFVKQDQ